MRMPRPRRRNVGPLLLAMVGVGVMIAGLAMHWWLEANGHAHRIEWIPQFIGAAIAFAGFYAMDPTGAKDGGGFLVDAGTKIVGVIRTGKRASDPVVTVTKSVEEPTAPGVELPLENIPPLAKIPASEKGP